MTAEEATMQFTYKPTGVCATEITLTVENDKLTDVQFTGGCNGSLKGVRSLVIGMPIGDIIARLDGILCKERPTSCPDQLACALRSLPR